MQSAAGGRAAAFDAGRAWKFLVGTALDESAVDEIVDDEFVNIASLGNFFETGMGEIGIMLAGSYAEQEAISFRPRVDRDG